MANRKAGQLGLTHCIHLSFDGIARYCAARPALGDHSANGPRLLRYKMQRKVRAFGHLAARKDGIKLRFGEKMRKQWRNTFKRVASA